MEIRKIEPLYLLNVILTFVLLSSLLVNATTDRSEPISMGGYDP